MNNMWLLMLQAVTHCFSVKLIILFLSNVLNIIYRYKQKPLTHTPDQVVAVMLFTI